MMNDVGIRVCVKLNVPVVVGVVGTWCVAVSSVVGMMMMMTKLLQLLVEVLEVQKSILETCMGLQERKLFLEL